MAHAIKYLRLILLRKIESQMSPYYTMASWAC